MRGSKVVATSMSSVVRLARKSGAVATTQSAKAPPARAAAACDSTAGCARASRACASVR